MRKAACLLLLAGVARAGSLSPQELRCEYRTNPAAIDATEPRLSWLPGSDERGQKQTAYQVLVAGDPAKLASNTGDLWDSGKINSGATMHVVYGGKPLASQVHCYWKVRVWDRDGHPSNYSTPAEWSMGLLLPSDWRGKWIGSGDQRNPNLPLLRHEFRTSKQVKQATVYVSGLGSFELHLNGEKVGDNVLEPGWTNYRKRCLYRTYDVTKQIRKGVNALGVMLGNGMYNVAGGRYVKFVGSFGPLVLILQLEIEFADGTSAQVISDGSWRVAPGPITFSCIYGGEDYDGRREQSGWDKPGFQDSGWKRASVMDGPGGRLLAESAPPVKIMREYEPVKVTEPKPGIYVYDLAQNFSGWPALTVSGPAGASVTLVPGELVDDKGLVTQKSSGKPFSFTYTLNGTGIERWHPRFSYYGFRYVQVEGATREASSTKPVVLNVTGQFIHSSSETSGSFSCSNDLFNRIHGLINAAILSNMQSVITDCPHREKLGWLEQFHFMAPSIMLNYDVARLYTKALDDMSDSQLPNGLVPDTAPEYVVFRAIDRDSPEWGSAYVEASWYVYQFYGDMAPLREHYDGMRAYVDYLTSRAEEGIIPYGVGDWVLPERLMTRIPPKGLTGTAVYYRDLGILEKTAALLGKTSDYQKYGALRARVGRAFNEKFLDRSTGIYTGGNQVANAMPLVLGIAETNRSAAIVDGIVGNIRSLGNHTSAGEIGWRYVLHALADAGRSDVVYDMLSRTDSPSYGYQLSRGATSLTEAWDTDPNESQNHLMLGEAEEWFYTVLAGLSSDPGAVGFDRIVIKPEPVGDVTWCKASYRSVRGLISSHWEILDHDLSLEVVIPPSTTATVYVPATGADSVTEGGRTAAQADGLEFLRMEPGKAVFAAASGTYHFISKGFK